MLQFSPCSFWVEGSFNSIVNSEFSKSGQLVFELYVIESIGLCVLSNNLIISPDLSKANDVLPIAFTDGYKYLKLIISLQIIIYLLPSSIVLLGIV